MTKLAKKIEDYKAPWEVDADGEDIPEDEQKLDPARLKKFLFGLLSDKDRLQTKVTSVTEERDAHKAQIDEITAKSGTDDEKRQREQQKAIDAAKAEGDLKALKLEVALGIDGITPAQARKLASRLTGKDQDELETDAAALAEDFGIGKAPEGETEEEEEPAGPASKPRRPRAQVDPKPNETKLPDPRDPAALAAALPRR